MSKKAILTELEKATPESLDVRSLLQKVDECLATMPMSQQFAFAGMVFEQLASIEARKAEIFAEEWEQFCHPTEPVLEFESDPDLFVQSQQIRWDEDLLEELEPHFYPKSRKSSKRSGSAVAADIAPEKMIEAISTLPEIVELSHEETIEEWVLIVRQHLTRRMKLTTLQKKCGLAIVPLWIALLFGGFAISREGDFYEGAIFVFPS